MKKEKAITDDAVFKYVFEQEKFFKYFINNFFRYIEINRTVHEVVVKAEVFIQGEEINEHDHKGDIVATLDNGDMISFEMYNNFGEEQYKKSLMYKTRLYSKQLKKKEPYKDAKKVYSINLVFGNYNNANPRLVNIKKFVDIYTNEIDTEDLQMVIIRLDKLSDSKYNVSDDKFINLLRFIKAKDQKEIEELMSKDEMLKEMREVVLDYLNDPDINSDRDNHRIELSQAREEGLEFGKAEEKISIARRLLENFVDEDTIVLATGLSKEKVLTLKDGYKKMHVRKKIAN